MKKRDARVESAVAAQARYVWGNQGRRLAEIGFPVIDESIDVACEAT